MTVRIYRSTDASAPSLTGQVGSLTSLLDAILVNGYGSQTAAGWTIGQTTTNKRGYLQNTTGSNNPSGVLLYVDDTGPGAGGAREARVCGFETMSAITPVGTGQFPTAAQSTIGVGTVVIRKSTTADATARAWTCIADGHTLYLFTETGDNTAPFAAFSFAFGDFFSYKTSDAYAVIIIGRTLENTSSHVNEPFTALNSLAGAGALGAFLSLGIIGHFAPRSWTGVGGSVMVGKHVDAGKMGGTLVGTGVTSGTGLANATLGYGLGRNISNIAAFPYPNGPDGALWDSPIWVHHNASVRGYLKGLWAPLQDRPLNHNDTYTVSGGNLNGKSFVSQTIVLDGNGQNFDTGQLHIETSDTWT